MVLSVVLWSTREEEVTEMLAEAEDEAEEETLATGGASRRHRVVLDAHRLGWLDWLKFGHYAPLVDQHPAAQAQVVDQGVKAMAPRMILVPLPGELPHLFQ